MRCPKCKGLVVVDSILSESMYWMDILRCVNCGRVTSKEVVSYAIKTEDKRTNRMDELELYRTRSRGTKCSSNTI